MGYCPSCGAATNPGATFCHSCGAGLPATPASRPTVAPGAPAPPVAYATQQPAPRARPIGVSIIGFVTIGFGAFAILAGLFVMLFMGALGAFFGSFGFGGTNALGGFFGALGVMLAMFVFAFAAFAIFVGVGTLRGSSWAWVAMLILMGLNALSGLANLASRDFGGVVTILVSGLVIWYFFQPDVKAWFGRG